METIYNGLLVMILIWRACSNDRACSKIGSRLLMQNNNTIQGRWEGAKEGMVE